MWKMWIRGPAWLLSQFGDRGSGIIPRMVPRAAAMKGPVAARRGWEGEGTVLVAVAVATKEQDPHPPTASRRAPPSPASGRRAVSRAPKPIHAALLAALLL